MLRPKNLSVGRWRRSAAAGAAPQGDPYEVIPALKLIFLEIFGLYL